MYVPDNGAVVGKARPTQQFFARSLTTNQTYLLDCGVPGIPMQDKNDTIQMWHRSKTTVNYMISGVSEAKVG